MNKVENNVYQEVKDVVVTLKIKRNSQKRKSTSWVMELKEVAKTEFSWTIKRDL